MHFLKPKFYSKPTYEVGSVWKEHTSQSVQLKERSVYKNKVRIICASPRP
jgi:hypothetical protein